PARRMTPGSERWAQRKERAPPARLPRWRNAVYARRAHRMTATIHASWGQQAPREQPAELPSPGVPGRPEHWVYPLVRVPERERGWDWPVPGGVVRMRQQG